MTIRLRQATRIYNPETIPIVAVDHVDLNIERGEFVSIMGPSGSGKTTLLNLMGGIDRATSGKIIINGVELNKLSDRELVDFRRDNIGFVFQNYSLLPVLTARENVEFIMLLQGHPAEVCEARAMELLKRVGLGDQANRIPAKLSGGQQQRVAVVRSLAANPDFVLADEPTANLDTHSAEELLDIMQQLNEEEGVTFIFSTHDQRVISRARRVIVFEDGHIKQDISKQDKTP